ncbi:MAG: glycosyltransferase family 39 protein, partial [Candidatus Binatia bacterium]
MFSAVVFLGSVAAVTASLARCLGPWAALAGGLLLVLEPWGVQYAHYGMNDVPLTAMLLLAWLAAGGIARGSKTAPLHAAACGIALGLGFAIKYQALIGLVFPVLAGWSLWNGGRGKTLAGSAAIFVTTWLGGVLFGSPLLPEHAGYFVEEFPRFMAWQANITGKDLAFHEKAGRNVVWLVRFLLSGWMWMLLPGAGYAAVRLVRGGGSPQAQVWVGSGLAFVVTLTALLLVSRDFLRANDVLPILPFLILLSVLWLAEPCSLRRRAFMGLAAVALIGAFAATSLADAAAFSRPDTRGRARQWCRHNLKPKARLLRERYVLSVDRAGIGEVAFRDFSSEKTRRTIADGRYDVVITSSLAHGRYFDPL